MKKLLVFLLLLIPGCINYIQEGKIYPDGTGYFSIHYWMQLPDNESLATLNKIGIFNPDSIKREFSSKFSVIKSVEVYADTVDSTMHAKIKLTFSNIDSLNNTKAFSDYNFSLRDGAAGLKIFSQFIPPIATGFGIDAGRFHVTYKYTFAGEIITNNAQIVDNNTLTWRYSLAEIGRGKTISVTFRPFKLKETPTWIYILTGFVLLIVIVFLFRKKKD